MRDKIYYAVVGIAVEGPGSVVTLASFASEREAREYIRSHSPFGHGVRIEPRAPARIPVCYVHVVERGGRFYAQCGETRARPVHLLLRPTWRETAAEAIDEAVVRIKSVGLEIERFEVIPT